MRDLPALVCAAWLAAASGVVRAADVVPWQAAASREGDVVTVEGDVAQARLEGATCVLEFAPENAAAFRVVLLIPLITNLPRQPQRLYEGKRVRATGKVQRWRGRPEMIVRSPDAIEVVGIAGTPAEPPPLAPAAPPRATPTTSPRPPTTTSTSPPPPPPQPTTPASRPLPSTTVPSPAAPPSTIPPPFPPETPAAAPRLPGPDPCVTARDRWRRAAGAAEARAAELTRCLRAGGYRCRPEAAAMAPALSELEWAEQQVETACP